MSIARRYVVMGLVVALGGCYQLNVESSGSVGSPIERRQNLFALGFYGDPNIDLKKECPSGIGNVRSRFTAADVLLTIASVGIYAPRTVVIECGGEVRR